MTMNEYKDYLVNWLKDQLTNTKCKGFVVGVSGGIDSAVVAKLATLATDNVLLISMPINSIEKEHDDSLKILDHLDAKNLTIDLSNEFELLKSKINVNDKLAISNIKPRLRMMTLYAHAQDNNYLVLGTDNFIEYMIGYFTKFGDGACDLLPIVNLNKAEVMELATVLELPEFVINKKPTAGLWEGQTDEDEIGISYDKLNKFTNKEELESADIDFINKLISRTAHKRNPIPKPNKYNDKIDY